MTSLTNLRVLSCFLFSLVAGRHFKENDMSFLSEEPAPGSLCNQKIDIVMLLDGSGSISRPQWVYGVLPFAKSVIQVSSVSEDTGRYAIAIFDSSLKIQVRFTEPISYNHEELSNKISNLQIVGGATVTGLALELTINELFPESPRNNKVPKLIVLFTDGQATDDVTNSIKLLRNSKIPLIYIAVGNYKLEEGRRVVGCSADLSDPCNDLIVGEWENWDPIVEMLGKRMCIIRDTDGVCELSEWSACSKSCYGGVKRRAYDIIIASSGKGEPCPANVEPLVEECNKNVICVGIWSDWGTCDCIDANSAKNRTRDLSIPPGQSSKNLPSYDEILCFETDCGPSPLIITTLAGVGIIAAALIASGLYLFLDKRKKHSDDLEEVSLDADHDDNVTALINQDSPQILQRVEPLPI